MFFLVPRSDFTRNKNLRTTKLSLHFSSKGIVSPFCRRNELLHHVSSVSVFCHHKCISTSFPSSSTGSHFSMLGIGDIVMPGLLLCFVLRYDNYKKQANGEVPGPGRMQRVSYFHCTLIGYFVGKQADRWADYIKGQGFNCFSCLGAIISGIFFCLSMFASTFFLWIIMRLMMM